MNKGYFITLEGPDGSGKKHAAGADRRVPEAERTRSCLHP